MIAWCGSSSDGLSWLRERCSSLGNLQSDKSLSIEALDAICHQHPRRLILAVDNRLSFPVAEIHYLQRTWPEIPWALAVGSWFDGSRRTGIGAGSQLSLPWYRWWDGWKPWLSGSQSELLNPWPRMVPTSDLITAHRQHAASSNSTGIIISNCTQSGEAWKAAFEGNSANSNQPATVQSLTLSQFQSQLGHATTPAPNWILWDDSSLNTFAGLECMSDVCALFSSIRKHYPNVLLIAATSMPRWSEWQEWMASGANELLVKPNHGVGLREIFSMA